MNANINIHLTQSSYDGNVYSLQLFKNVYSLRQLLYGIKSRGKPSIGSKNIGSQHSGGVK